MADVPRRVSWPDLIAMVKYSRPGTAVFVQQHGADGLWTLEPQLLARIGDSLNDLFWQQSVLHTPKGKQAPRRPQPFPRPGVKPQHEEGVNHLGSEPIPAADFAAWWESQSTAAGKYPDGKEVDST